MTSVSVLRRSGEGVLDAADKVLRRLAVDASLYALREWDSTIRKTSSCGACRRDQRSGRRCRSRPGPPRLARISVEKAVGLRPQPPDETPHAVIGAGEAVFDHQVLVNARALSPRSTWFESDRATVRTRSYDRGGVRLSPGPEGTMTARCFPQLKSSRAGGRIGWF